MLLLLSNTIIEIKIHDVYITGVCVFIVWYLFTEKNVITLRKMHNDIEALLTGQMARLK